MSPACLPLLFVGLLLPMCNCCFGVADEQRADQQRVYQVTDPDLKIVLLDSSATESFLAVRADTAGRLFVGAREALFVYETSLAPQAGEIYGERQELFRFPADSWIYDIEIRGDDVYVMTNRALYLLKGAVKQRDELTAQRLIWGHPNFHPHQCLHGLAWGPDGDLYMSIGDLLVWYGDFMRPDHWGHWTFMTQPTGTKVPFTGVGSFMRCRPDGSNFQVIARGARNSCGIAFDSRWNLFSHDNDHEGLPTDFSPGRLLHVTPQADFGWPRGWMPSMTPDRADLLETMFTGMGRAVPVGQSYYDEQYLPEKYRHNILLARWGNRTISRYPLRERGASFQADEHILLQGMDQARPVSVTVGRGGRIFATIAYMAHNEGSPTYRSDLVMITRKDDPAHHPFEGYDCTTSTEEKLWSELANASSWRSRRALVELTRRGQTSAGKHLAEVAIKELQGAVDGRRPRPATHLIWLAATLCHESSSSEERVAQILEDLVKRGDAKLRFQAIRALVEFFGNSDSIAPLLAASLNDEDPQCRHAAVVGLFKSDEIPASLVEGPARSSDTYLRQVATQVLAEKFSIEQLTDLCRAEDPGVRLAGVLAVGIRLTIPPATEPLGESLPLQPWPDPKVYEVAYDGETVDVRTLGPIGIFTISEHWAAGSHTPEQEQLFAMLVRQLADADDQVRLQAAHFLSLLDDDRAEPLIDKVRTVSERQRLTNAKITEVHTVWTIGPFHDAGQGFGAIHAPETGAIDLSAEYSVGGRQLTWEKYEKDPNFDFRKRFGEAGGTSRYAFFRLNSAKQQQVLFTPGSDDGMRVWHNGKLVYEIDEIRGALPLQDVIYLKLEPGSNDFLIRVRNVSDEHMMYLHYRAPASISWSLPEKLDTASLEERLRAAAADGGTLDPKLLETDWVAAAAAGDPQRGRQLFSADGIGCAKCHAAEPNAPSAGGPGLAAAGSRFTIPYLVESILLPSKTIAPAFKGAVILIDSGVTPSGLVINETAEKLVLLTPESKQIEVNKSEIVERREMELSPMPAGMIKESQELRDLLAYLMQLR